MKGPTSTRKSRRSERMNEQTTHRKTGYGKRSWPVSLGWAVALVGTAVAFSAVVNPLFGRSVHWDWMAGLAPTLFVLLTLALRRRWL